jgi:hypothetical protein
MLQISCKCSVVVTEEDGAILPHQTMARMIIWEFFLNVDFVMHTVCLGCKHSVKQSAKFALLSYPSCLKSAYLKISLIPNTHTQSLLHAKVCLLDFYLYPCFQIIFPHSVIAFPRKSQKPKETEEICDPYAIAVCRWKVACQPVSWGLLWKNFLWISSARRPFT